MVGRLAVAALSWAATVLIARRLGQEGFGQFTLVFSLLGMMSIVTDLGLGRVAVAAYASAGERAAEFAGSYILLRAVLGLVGYGAALGWVTLAGYPSTVIAATAVGGLVVVFATPSSAYDLAFQVRNRLGLLAAAGVLGQLAQVALAVALVLRGGNLVWLVVPAVLNDGLVLIWKRRMAHRLVPFVYRVDLAVWMQLVRSAAPLTLGAAFATLYYRVDSLMLASLDSFRSVGAYGVAYKFVDLVQFVPTALTLALMAPLSMAWIDDRAAFDRHLRDGFRILAVAAGAALLGFWIYPNDVARLFYGQAYSDTGMAIRLLITAESIGFFSALATTVLLAAGRHRRYPWITFAGLVVNIAVNALVIPHWSYEGAAAATLLTELLVGALIWRLVVRSGLATNGLLEWRVALGVAAAVAAGAATGLAVGLVAPWFVGAATAGVFYVACVVRMRLVDPAGLGFAARGSSQ